MSLKHISTEAHFGVTPNVQRQLQPHNDQSAVSTQNDTLRVSTAIISRLHSHGNIRQQSLQSLRSQQQGSSTSTSECRALSGPDKEHWFLKGH